MEKRKPKILIASGKGEPKNYIAALEAVGADTAWVYAEIADPKDYDGLLLSGGEDVAPARYGEEPNGSGEPDLARDAGELALIEAFFAAGKPILGICRGSQILNVALGGTLVQHLPTAPTHGGPGDHIHPVEAAPGSILAKLYGERFFANSTHHQAVKDIAPACHVTARAEDGTVEAFEHDTRPVFAVQFHPERMTLAFARPDTVDGIAIFKTFADLCKN